MDTLELLKARLGISASTRDTYLNTIIESVKKELTEEKGIELDGENMAHEMFVVDYATWRYQSRDSTEDMPQHIKWRLKNLFLHDGGKDV